MVGMKHKKYYKLRAFTLIEVSIVILIIGIMLAGTFIGTRIIAKSRLAAAESLARSSPVPGIKDNMLWLETSLSASIDNSQANDGSFVTSWYDQSSNATKPLVVAVGTGPTYANTINHVHAIKFDGSTANYLQISDASFLNGTDYTIMVLEKRQSSASNNYFIGETSSNPNDSLALGYSSDSTVIHAQGNQSYATGASVSSYASSTEKPRQFTFVHSSTAGNSTYINGILAAQDATKTAHLSGITSLAIGKGYTGEIGEIAIFARALKPEERQPVEDYAGKKWTRSINRASAPSGSCVGYTITDSGCDLASATCNISQAGISATVAATSSSTSIACNQTNYSGSVSYTCISGTASVSGSCNVASPCSVTPTGVSAAINVASGSSGSVACDVANYSGNAAFTCSNGTPTYTSQCTCLTGYTGSGCGTCDSANNYVSVSSNCVKGCAVPTSSGTTLTTVVSGTTSTACNASGYSGTLQYTCNNSGVFAVTSACTALALCTGGTITSVAGKTIHKFMSGGTFTCPSARTAEVLIVGGGGGGTSSAGDGGGGGGGAGGVVYAASFSISTSAYSVVVGAGGNIEASGGSSSFGGMTALGGGYGGKWNGSATTNGTNGGSGGGAGGAYGASGGTSTQSAQTGQSAHYGNAGGLTTNYQPPNEYFVGGGGGGSGGVGANGGNATVGGAGGQGRQFSISGTATYYAAGGGGSGGKYSTTGGAGGNSIGGSGGTGSGAGSTAGGNAAANTGSGGGGSNNNTSGGRGGSGVVIVSY